MQIFLTGILVLIRILSNSLSNVFQKKLAEYGENPVCINFINYLLLALFCVPLIFLTHNQTIQNGFWLNALIGGVCGALCNYYMVEALKYGELSVLGPINSYKSVIGLIFAIFLLGEIPDFHGLLGVLLIIFGSYFIFDTLNPIKIAERKDIQYRFLALFFSAMEAVFIKKVILLSSIRISFIASCFLGAIFSYIIFKLTTKTKLTIPKPKSALLYLLTALCFGLMTYTTAVVFKRINVGYALSLFQLSVILNLLFGWKIFKEKHILRKLTGSVIIICGAVLVIIFSH